jgi:uracil-DNA glycosylase
MGLAFSVPKGKKIPPSLKNIFKKLGKTPESGDLTHWAEQGVLLLNTALTVREHSSNSHSIPWRNITNNMIKHLSDSFEGLVFILWGGNAFSKIEFIDKDKHHVLISSHPSPLGCRKPMKGNSSFNDCNHFNECNDILKPDKINF